MVIFQKMIHLVSAVTLSMATVAGGSDFTSFLQAEAAVTRSRSHVHHGLHLHAGSESEPAAWPHTRGSPPHYSYTSSGFTGSNLTASLAWTWDGGPTVLWSTLIDADKNIYVSGMNAIVKFSPDGQILWEKRGLGFRPASLMDGALFAMDSMSATLLCIDVKTGKVIWQQRVASKVGAAGDMVEAYDGVVIVGVGRVPGWRFLQGIPSLQAQGLDASTGKRLWDFQPDCGFWQLMPLFPGDDTAILMDQCGGLYRIGLHNGTLVWRAPGSPGSFSDGGAILGPDGGTYTCSMPDGSNLTDVIKPNAKGSMRKYRLADGRKLWETETPMPCLNMPAVSHDGRTVFTAVGALTPVDGPPQYLQNKILAMKPEQKMAFFEQEQTLMREQRHRAHWNMTDLRAMVLGLNTETGEMQLRYELEPYGNILAAGDYERNWGFWIQKRPTMPHCGPPALSSITVDSKGRLYFGRNNGQLYVLDSKTGTYSEFNTGDGFMIAGVTFAPGMMVVPTCGKLFVFKYEEA